MRAIFILCTLLVCLVVLLRLSWGVGTSDTQDVTSSDPKFVSDKDLYASYDWSQDVIKNGEKDNDLNAITGQDILKSKARLQKLLTILRQEPPKDNYSKVLPVEVEATSDPSNAEDTTILCNPVIDENCEPESIGPRLSATLLKILA
ncbi:uncharacterized protein LOC26535715 [Drosophila yakuba]|uniref:Uncharacterized protein n=1 Tax=Drosophila yakuba TaxID=7245 RepID=A0A0R1E9D7_DROYA|nr:uncharacterized protein LOC26535715 [Drosophila yakuba]XP_039232104.1 uncharacterized protein LOC26535715 [Drosophila yakuba]KRK04106.1 uncharacterized protein Dyak_GE28534 [Drosophila yakuba]